MKYVGKDGTPVFYLSDEDFNQKLNDVSKDIPKEQWPHTKKDRYTYTRRHGYYPNGMALLKEKYTSDTVRVETLNYWPMNTVMSLVSTIQIISQP